MGGVRVSGLKAFRLGIAVTHERICAVLCSTNVPVWWGERDRGESLEADIITLLGSLPRRRWRRIRASIAFGSTLARVKRLQGLPPSANEQTLERIIGTSLSHYFYVHGAAYVLTSVQRASSDAVWAGVLDAEAVRATLNACRRTGVKGATIVPAEVVLARLSWTTLPMDSDAAAGHDTTDANGSSGRPRPRARAPTPLVARTLAVMGEAADRYLEAYAACQYGFREPVAYAPAEKLRSQNISRTRGISAWCAFAASVLMLLAAPGIVAERDARESEASLRSLAAERVDAALTERALISTRERVSELVSWQASSGGVIALLREMSGALPPSSALTLIRLDTIQGSAVVLTPRSAAVLAALEKTRQAGGFELAGPITQERLADLQLERVALRFARVSRMALPASSSNAER